MSVSIPPKKFPSVRTDVASSTVTYVGVGGLSIDTSMAHWRIFRMTTDANGGVVIEWADGDSQADNIWDNRVSLSYS